KAFGEILRRSSETLKMIENVLAEVRQIRFESTEKNRDAKSAEFETDYRRIVMRQLDKLELFGAKVSTISREQSLSVAYVSLSISLANKGTSIKDIRVTANEILALGKPRWFIRGDAGSGKTTLLQWLAVNSAAQRFPAELSFFNDKIPFFIPLRFFTNHELPSPKNFIRPVASVIADEMPEGWVNEQLKNGRAVILIDGVDEVPSSDRENVRKWIAELTLAYPDCWYIVSSRPSAVNTDWLNKDYFESAQLLAMERGEVLIFIENWHNAVKDQLHVPEEIDELENLRHNIKNVIWHHAGIRELATNPLLCAMLCALHRDRRQQLPSDRIELYEECSYMLLEKRDTERKIYQDNYPKLSYRQKKYFLQGLAYWMLRNGLAVAETSQVIDTFQRKVNSLREVPISLKGKDILNLFLERSGMLRVPSANEISFTHRTFQEFFAALAAVDEEDIGFLKKQIDNDDWVEVIILAAGVAPKVIRNRLIQEIIKDGDKTLSKRHYLLALACTYSSVEASLPEDEFKKIREKTISILPPKSPQEISRIKIAGDAITPFLHANNGFTASEMANCIEALYLIGSKDALNALQSYVAFQDPLILEKLLTGREFFEDQIYDQDILYKCSTQKSFASSSINSLDGIQYFSELEEISVTLNSKISDLSPLRNLKKLKHLNLQGCENIQDIEPLSNLTNIESLNLSACPNIQYITPLSTLKNLKELAITNNVYISDLTPLENLSNLESINLDNCPLITSLDALKSCSLLKSISLSLEYIKVANKDTGISIGGIRNKQHIKSLDLRFRQINDLTSIKDLKNIQSLKITLEKNISNIKFLENMRLLEELILLDCVSITKIGVLLKLKNLRKLEMSHADKIKNFSILEQLSSLKEFHYVGKNEDEIPSKFSQEKRRSATSKVFISYASSDQFVGRKAELEHFSSLLDSKDGQTFLIQGAGGIGKTRLVQKILSQTKNETTSNMMLDLFPREKLGKSLIDEVLSTDDLYSSLSRTKISPDILKTKTSPKKPSQRDIVP
ncbi:NACHT domain-containing protein, partial [bacterium]